MIFDNTRKKVQETTDSVAAEILAEPDEVPDAVAGGDDDDGVERKCGQIYKCGMTCLYCMELGFG